MPDAALVASITPPNVPKTSQAAFGAYEVQQGADGRAQVYNSATANVSGTQVTMRTDGVWALTKPTGQEYLDGQELYWDFVNNRLSYRKNNNRDFFVGTVVGNAASADILASVNLNVRAHYLLDIARDPYATVPVGTQALGGFLPPARQGGKHKLKLTATSEAQKLDILTDDGTIKDGNAIFEAEVNIQDDGAGTVVDFNIGIASATNATDADAIAEHAFFHFDANVVDIRVQTKDPSTTVASTDTTIDYTLGTRFFLQIDMRDPTSVKFYVNAVRVLSATVFNMNASVATLKILVHVEKTSSTEIYEVDIDSARLRIAEQ